MKKTKKTGLILMLCIVFAVVLVMFGGILLSINHVNIQASVLKADEDNAILDTDLYNTFVADYRNYITHFVVLTNQSRDFIGELYNLVGSDVYIGITDNEDEITLRDGSSATGKTLTLYTSQDKIYLSGVLSGSGAWAGGFFSFMNLKDIDLSKFDTSMVTDMSLLFSACHEIKTINLSSFNTENVKYMDLMFDACFSLEEVVFGEEFNTVNVEDMSGMFNVCPCLRLLDLSKFDTSSLKNAEGMFFFHISLNTIDMSNFDLGSIDTTDNMACQFFGTNNHFSTFICGDNDSYREVMAMFIGCQVSELTEQSVAGALAGLANLERPVNGCYKAAQAALDTTINIHAKKYSWS